MSCKFCSLSLSDISSRLLLDKYSLSFSFCFAKPINEIIHNERLSHVFLLKDFQILDDENSKPNISTFYSFSVSKLKEILVNNIGTFEPSLILFTDLPPIKAKFSATAKKNSQKSKKTISNSQNSKFSSFENNFLNKFDENEDDDDNPLEYIKKSRIKLAEERLNQTGSFIKDLERHLEVLSFETKEFNIYDPEYSSEESFHKNSFEEFQEIHPKKNTLKKRLSEIDVTELEIMTLNSQKNPKPLLGSKIEDCLVENYQKKVQIFNKNTRSITDKTSPVFLIKKKSVIKGQESNKDNSKNQIQASLKKIKNCKSMNSYPIYSTSFSNTTITKILTENKSKYLEEDKDNEDLEIKSNSLKKKIMEMNRIYNKKPIFFK